MAIETGLLEQLFVKAEAAYNDTTYVAGLAAGDAFLHRRAALRGKNNRVPSPEKTGTPGRRASLPRRKTAEFSIEAAWQPSGVLGTASDIGELLKAGFGSQVASGSGSGVTTTVSASPSPTATSCTVASATGMAVNDCIVVTMPAGHRECTRIKTIATNALTFDSLSVAPASGAAVVDGVNYKLTTALPQSLAILKAYTAGTKQETVAGAVVNQVDFRFPGSEEVTVQFSGPAARYRRSGATVPGSMTTAGEPVSSFVGNDYLDTNAFLMTDLKVMLMVNQGLRNLEIGTEYATGRYRNGWLEARVEATFYFEDARIQDAAEAITRHVVRHVTGGTNGSMVGVVCPKVEWEIPDVPDSGEGPLIITASGVAYDTSGNDNVFVFEA